MYQYFILLILALLLFANSTNNNHSKGLKRVYFFLTLLLLALFAGLRNYTVGTDTNAYIRAFNDFYQNYKTTEFSLFSEYGYKLINAISHFISDEYWSLLFTQGLIYSLIILISIKKYSLNPKLSLFFFITLGYYVFSFNAARQAIALSIFLYSFQYIFQKKYLNYLICILIAALFHKTIIIVAPLYFVFKLKFNYKTFLLISIFLLIISLFLDKILLFSVSIEDRYSLYSTKGTTGGYFLMAFYIIITLFFIIMRSGLNDLYKKNYDIYLNMCLIGTLFFTIVIINGAYIELTRFSQYFHISTIFLWAILFKNHYIFKHNLSKIIVYIIHICFYYIYISKIGNYSPYILNTNIF